MKPEVAAGTQSRREFLCREQGTGTFDSQNQGVDFYKRAVLRICDCESLDNKKATGFGGLFAALRKFNYFL